MGKRSEKDEGFKPQLSIVTTSRNDGHGGDLLERMQAFVDGVCIQAKRHRFFLELIIVEWNPPPENPGLADALRWQTVCEYVRVRIVEVPPDFHESIENRGKIPLYQMIAKNVGIRRAKGDFVLATNIDVIFPDALFDLMKNDLKKGVVYRNDRIDIPRDIPGTSDFDSFLKFCGGNAIRKNKAYGTYVLDQGKWVRDSPEKRNTMKGIFLSHLQALFTGRENGPVKSSLTALKSFFTSEKALSFPGMLFRRGPSFRGLWTRPAGSAKFVVSGISVIISNIGSSIRRFASVVENHGWLVYDRLYSHGIFGKFLAIHSKEKQTKTAFIKKIIIFFIGIPIVVILFLYKAIIYLGITSADFLIKTAILVMHLFKVNYSSLVSIVNQCSFRQKSSGFQNKLNSLIDKTKTHIEEVAGRRRRYLTQLRMYSLHTNGCGDFTLLDRESWFRLRGYVEWPVFSWHLDSLFLFQAYINKLRIVKLPERYGIFHIDHGGGWTPESQKALFHRLEKNKIPYLTYEDFLDKVEKMHVRKRKEHFLVMNDREWGHQRWDLPEIVISTPETIDDIHSAVS